MDEPALWVNGSDLLAEESLPHFNQVKGSRRFPGFWLSGYQAGKISCSNATGMEGYPFPAALNQETFDVVFQTWQELKGALKTPQEFFVFIEVKIF